MISLSLQSSIPIILFPGTVCCAPAAGQLLCSYQRHCTKNQYIIIIVVVIVIMSGIDYSKWDHLECSSSDDDDDDRPSNNVRVTRLEQPSTIVLGGGGGGQQDPTILPTATTTSTPTTNSENGRKEGMRAIEFVGGNNGTSSSAAAATSGRIIPDSWTAQGAAVDLPPMMTTATTTMTKDNADEDSSFPPSGPSKLLVLSKLYWSQDRYCTVLRFPLPPKQQKESSSSVSYMCCVTNILSYLDRHNAIFTSERPLQHLSITRSATTKTTTGTEIKNSVAFEGDLVYPVHLAEDDDQVDWTIENCLNDEQQQQQQRVMVITLYKATPMHGVTVWWKRPLEQCPEVDLATVRGQPPGKKETPEQQQSFQKVWKEAHAAFQEKITAKKREQKHST